ncbi:hypothetical protein [Stakelama tenebrarum]|uniref:hypothetical protein n=1 Tax=Stakelama tenebrarum TaxID=2711215 RepID=UPI001D196349|nr:hypothetical protein [Sphingosinithalassobacter tenebrarum]
MAGWVDVHFGREGDRCIIDGIDVWKEEWRWIGGKTISLPHPFDSSQRHSFSICEVGSTRRPVRFAASKMPEGLWAFYVPA